MEIFVGNFSIHIDDIVLESKASLGIDSNGKLRIRDVNIEPMIKNMTTNFENLGFAAEFIQKIINSKPTEVLKKENFL